MSHGLNEAQSEAVRTLSGPMLVLAGAGTGKTRVITFRIANLIRNGVRPERILAVTFTNKAAREMRERIDKLMGSRSEEKPFISTFHSLCVNVLRAEIDRLGYSKKFPIYARRDQESAARAALREARIDPKALKPAELLFRVSKWKTMSLRPDDVTGEMTDEKDRLARLGYRHYEARMQSSGVLDFDDLILCTEELFADHPDVLARQQARFDHILVDEYQDTSANQYRIIRALSATHGNLCVVGDDDQSIYGWRGAEVKNILGFDRDFKNAKVIRLEENYRSCPNILQLANQLIHCNRDRHPKTLRASRIATDTPLFHRFDTETDEAEGVVRDLAATAAKNKLPFRDFAILFRTNEQPRLFEQELRARAIPYMLVGGYSFFDRKEVQDVLAYLRVIVHPADEDNLLRVINTPPRGIGDTIQERLVGRAVSAGKPVWEILPDVIAENALPSKAMSGLRSFYQWMRDYQQRFQQVSVALTRNTVAQTFLSVSLAQLARDLMELVNYRDEIARSYDEPAEQQKRWDSVGEILNMIAQYEQRSKNPTLDGFLEEITLDDKDFRKEDDDRKDAVTLMTLHSAKGLEFPHVYLVGLEEGILPHERSLSTPSGIAEERRLAYVGITRARDRLILTRANTRTRFGRRQTSDPSRFLPEMFGKTNSSSSSSPKPSLARQ